MFRYKIFTCFTVLNIFQSFELDPPLAKQLISQEGLVNLKKMRQIPEWFKEIIKQCIHTTWHSINSLGCIPLHSPMPVLTWLSMAILLPSSVLVNQPLPAPT